MAASSDSENAQQLKSELSASLNEKNYSKDEGKTATVTPYLVIKKEDNFTLKREETTDLERKVQEGLKQYDLFSQSECEVIERKLEELMADFNRGLYKPSSLDRSKLRNKYFFGERYTYGDGFGQEMLFPVGQIDPIPTWITEMVIAPLEEAGILPVGFTNSAVINLYLPGGCIVSHIDPPHIFDRPIVSASFLSDTVLSFGCKFSFKPIRSTCPVTTVRLRRGSVVSMEGYAANNITHCIRPQDIKYRRAAIILRRVLPDAPRMSMANFYSLAQLHPGFSFLRLRRKRSWEETEQLTTHVRRKRARVDFHGNI